MPTFAIIDLASAEIVNRIVLDDPESWTPDDGHSIVEETTQIFEIGGHYQDGEYEPPPAPAPITLPAQILSQDLMAQFTTEDAAKIKDAVSNNTQLWLLWSAMQAQSNPMVVTNARFLAGWQALTSVLGSARMAEIATTLGINPS